MSDMQAGLELLAEKGELDLDPFRIIPSGGVEKFVYETSVDHATGVIMQLIADITASKEYEIMPGNHVGIEQFYVNIGLRRAVAERSRFSRIKRVMGIRLSGETNQDNPRLPIASAYFTEYRLDKNQSRAMLVLECRNDPATLPYRQEILTIFSNAYQSTKTPSKTSPAHSPLQTP